ncbi:MAG: hypothetical protein WCE49_16155 [Terrimicrobiaceae bacterium]
MPAVTFPHSEGQMLNKYRAFLDAVLDERLAQDRARLDAREAQAVAKAQARVTQAEKRLCKAISKELENRLPTSKSGDKSNAIGGRIQSLTVRPLQALRIPQL